ncbi:MAG: EAL domain-containing protein, partial [Pseudomonadota bacterium]
VYAAVGKGDRTTSRAANVQRDAREVVDRLKEVGARIALDDYGSGYASLSLLRSLPFDKIKIDRSFIDALDDDKQAAAIVRSTLVLGRSLSIPVLAEGVETADHAGFLMAEGCQEVQGYHFGRPLPLDDAEALIAEDDLALHARAGARSAAEVGAGGGAAA